MYQLPKYELSKPKEYVRYNGLIELAFEQIDVETGEVIEPFKIQHGVKISNGKYVTVLVPTTMTGLRKSISWMHQNLVLRVCQETEKRLVADIENWTGLYENGERYWTYVPRLKKYKPTKKFPQKAANYERRFGPIPFGYIDKCEPWLIERSKGYDENEVRAIRYYLVEKRMDWRKGLRKEFRAENPAGSAGKNIILENITQNVDVFASQEVRKLHEKWGNSNGT